MLWHIGVSCSAHSAGTDSCRGSLSAVVLLLWYMASTHVPRVLFLFFFLLLRIPNQRAAKFIRGSAEVCSTCGAHCFFPFFVCLHAFDRPWILHFFVFSLLLLSLIYSPLHLAAAISRALYFCGSAAITETRIGLSDKFRSFSAVIAADELVRTCLVGLADVLLMAHQRCFK